MYQRTKYQDTHFLQTLEFCLTVLFPWSILKKIQKQSKSDLKLPPIIKPINSGAVTP